MDMDMDMDIDMTRTWVNTYIHTHLHIYKSIIILSFIIITTNTTTNTTNTTTTTSTSSGIYSTSILLTSLGADIAYLLTIHQVSCQTNKKKRELIGIRRDLLEGRGGEGRERSERTPDVNGDEGMKGM